MSEYQVIFKALQMKFATKAMQTFDRATMVVVGVCWGAAMLMIIFALYAVVLSASTRRAAETAAAAEPVLPKIVRKSIDLNDAQPLVDRLQHRFPNINIALNSDQSINISTLDGPKFRDWITAVSYIDTISPKYRWSIKEFCVGKCTGGALMRAVMVGERITFEPPREGGEKDKR